MKNIIGFVFIGLMIVSCGSTQEVEIQKPVVNETLSKRDRPQKKSDRIDPEQMVAQLGLSEERGEEFLTMWNSTGAAMKKVRQEHKGDRDMLRQKMMEVKYERDEGLKNILTEAELQHLHELMKKRGGQISTRKRRMDGIDYFLAIF